MSQKNQGNKQSMKGEYKGHGKNPTESIHSEVCGSSSKHGVRFKVPDHHGMGETEGGVHKPKAS